jgi:hypothetical protein
MAMLYRIEMDVFHIPDQFVGVANLPLPITSLPNAAFAARNRHR